MWNDDVDDNTTNNELVMVHVGRNKGVRYGHDKPKRTHWNRNINDHSSKYTGGNAYQDGLCEGSVTDQVVVRRKDRGDIQ